jgi:hypothetical protein
MFFMTLHCSTGLFLALFNDVFLTVSYVRSICNGDKEIPKGCSRILF